MSEYQVLKEYYASWSNLSSGRLADTSLKVFLENWLVQTEEKQRFGWRIAFDRPGVRKSQEPHRSGTGKYLWVLNMDLATCRLYGAWNFDMPSRFLENVYTPVMCDGRDFNCLNRIICFSLKYLSSVWFGRFWECTWRSIQQVVFTAV